MMFSFFPLQTVNGVPLTLTVEARCCQQNKTKTRRYITTIVAVNGLFGPQYAAYGSLYS